VKERTLCPILVGRESELTSLEDALIDAARADGRFVVIAGDAGMGKTRLTSEAQGCAAKLGFTTLRGGCAPMDVAIPYLPLLEAAGNGLARSDLARVRTWVGPAAAELGGLFPQLEGDPQPQARNAGGDGTLRLFESVVMLLSALGEGGPVLFIIEDLQWSDPATRDLVDYLARRAPSLPLLVLATYRSDELHRRHPLRSTVHGWRRSGLAEFVELGPLKRDDVSAMSQAILDDEVSEEFRDYIHERTEGSPLALEEMLREAIDRGDIFRSARGWDRKPLTQLRIPRAVAEIVLLRLDRLDEHKTSVLSAASVLGRSFSYGALAAITTLVDSTVRSALEDLVKDQMLEPDAEARGSFRFRHALIQEAVYDQILSPHRDELHLRVARVLRDANAPAVEVGSHLLRGGRIDDAVPVLLVAADEAMTNFAARTAVEVYMRVLPHIGDPALRGRVLCRLGESLWRSSQPTAAERCLRDAIAVLIPGDDPAVVARCRHLLGACLHDQGRADEEEAEYQAAIAMLAPLGPSEDLATVYLRLSRLRWSRCDDAGTIAMAADAINVAELSHADAVRIWAGTYLGAATADQGDADAGLEVLQRCCDEAVAKQMYWIAASALRLEMDVLIRALRHSEVPALLSRLRAVPGMSPADEAVAGCIEATVAFDEGDVARCVALVEDAQKQARRAGQEHVAEGATLLRAAAHLARDELLAARSLLSPIESTSSALLELLLPFAMTLDIVENDVAAAATKAQVALARLDGTEVGAIISEAAVRAFVAAERIDEAERLLSSAHNFAGPAREPYLERAGGAIALAAGRTADAIGLLERAAATFAGFKSTWEELWTRLLLARARAASGETEAAAADLASASGDAERAGIWLISRIAREIHAALNLPVPERAAGSPTHGVPAEHEPDLVGSGGTVSVAATAIGARGDRWWAWGAREAQRLHGVVGVAPGVWTATFTSTGPDDGWTNAFRFALGLRDKGTLLGVQVSAGIAGAVTSSTRLLAATASNDILASEDMSSQARSWLESRELIDRAPTPEGSVRLRSRVTASRAAAPTRSDAPPVERRNEFVLEGDFWSVRYAGRTVRLKDTKGFHDIALLLAAEGTEVAAVDLIGARTPASANLSGIADGYGIERDAGGVLDPEAREQYRSRVRELELELEDAAAAHDPVREERARDEREFLLTELRSAVGLHGRTRRAIDPSERARKAVTWRIRDAITRAEAAHPPFGHHLRRSVRTGTLCVYDPPEPTPWTLVRSCPNP
jgi:tetratricopeptide (TPR) repeat protein